MNNNLILCPVCQYYFPNYRIRHHKKLCQTLFTITGKRNNNLILSNLSTFQQSQLIQYFNSHKTIPTTSASNTPSKTTTTASSNTPSKTTTASTNTPSGTVVQYNRYRYNSLHQARRPKDTPANVPVLTYQDQYFKNKMIAYNRSRVTPSSQKQNEIIVVKTNNPPPRQITHSNYTGTNSGNRGSNTSIKSADVGVDNRMVIYQPTLSMVPVSTNFHHLVGGKDIALVGPSKSILGRKLGDYIESFHLVVRLNKGIFVPENRYQDIGVRTDILYNSLNTSDFPGENNLDPRFLLKNKLKYLCGSYPNIHPFQKDIINFMNMNRGQIPFRHIDLELFMKMENILKTRPYTGMCAIVDLLKFNINSLFITGLDFYATSYYSEYRVMDSEETKKKQKNNIHDAKPQINLLRVLALTDSRIILDKVLDTILFRQYRTFIKQVEQQKFKNIFTPLKNSSNKKLVSLMNINSIEKPHLYFLSNNYNGIIKDKNTCDIVITNIDYPYSNNANIMINTLKTAPPKELKTDVVINIHPFKVDLGEEEYEMVNFNSEYNRYMNKALSNLGIDACSINFYIIIFLTIFMNKYVIHILGFEQLLSKREENLFFRFLVKNKNIYCD